MFCSNCGSQLIDGAKFCSNCGSPVTGLPTQTTQESQIPAQTAPVVPEESPLRYEEVKGKTLDIFDIAMRGELFEAGNTNLTVPLLQKEHKLGWWESVKLANKWLHTPKLREEYEKWRYPDGFKLRCPRCKSDKIETGRKGYSAVKGITAGLLTGGIGLVAGFHGKNKIELRCLVCGHKWSTKE